MVDALDRLTEQAPQAEHLEPRARLEPRRLRDRVGDPHLGQTRVVDALDRRAAEHAVARGGVHAVAPCSRTAVPALQSVPAVSIMSSTRIAFFALHVTDEVQPC